MPIMFGALQASFQLEEVKCESGCNFRQFLTYFLNWCESNVAGFG